MSYSSRRRRRDGTEIAGQPSLSSAGQSVIRDACSGQLRPLRTIGPALHPGSRQRVPGGHRLHRTHSRRPSSGQWPF
jgi:hypothetical protein